MKSEKSIFIERLASDLEWSTLRTFRTSRITTIKSMSRLYACYCSKRFCASLQG